MKKDKIIAYVLTIMLCIITFFNLFLPSTIQKGVLVSSILVYTIICYYLLKFKKIDNLNKKKIILLSLVLSIIYVLILYILGIFVGFYKNQIIYYKSNLLTRFVPYILIVVFTEIIRQIFITRNEKKTVVIATIGIIFIDVMTYIESHSVWDLSAMLELVGYVMMPAISINLLCNYIAKRYGIIPNILYRIITVAHIYIAPIVPDIYMFFESVFKIIYPYIVYLILDTVFERNKFKQSRKYNRYSVISMVATLIIILAIIMLVSCKFKYGILVTGSSSMTGSIDMGDTVVFEQYQEQALEEGQIIIFVKDDKRLIHRINNVQIKNNETIYYTKGDSNPTNDEGYITSDDIIGVVKFKIIDIGWPTLWLNKLFEK